MSLRDPVVDAPVLSQCTPSLPAPEAVERRLPGLDVTTNGDLYQGSSLVVGYTPEAQVDRDEEVLREVLALVRERHPHLHILNGNVRTFVR